MLFVGESAGWSVHLLKDIWRQRVSQKNLLPAARVTDPNSKQFQTWTWLGMSNSCCSVVVVLALWFRKRPYPYIHIHAILLLLLLLLLDFAASALSNVTLRHIWHDAHRSHSSISEHVVAAFLHTTPTGISSRPALPSWMKEVLFSVIPRRGNTDSFWIPFSIELMNWY